MRIDDKEKRKNFLNTISQLRAVIKALEKAKKDLRGKNK